MKIAQVAPLIEMTWVTLPKTHHASFEFLLISERRSVQEKCKRDHRVV
jgi:hypothetical protein